MIITISGANFSASNIGTLSTWTVSKSIGAGAEHSIPSYVDKNSAFNYTITLKDGYTFGTYSVTMGGQTITPTVTETSITINIASVTGAIRIEVKTINSSTGEEDRPVTPERPGTGGDTGGDNTGGGTTGNGQWLSVLVTGDTNAHTEFMNYTETTGALTNVPCAYVKPEIQKHLSGKRVTKVACFALGSDSSISFYTNDYVSESGTTSGDSVWKRVYTLSDPSSKVAAGTKTKKEYNVNFTIEEGDTLAFYDMEKMYSPANKEGIMSYVLPVRYTMNPGTKYGTALPNFIAFDFYVE